MPRIPTIHTQLQVFHAPHEEERDFRPFTDYLIQLQESVKRHLFNELPLEKTLEREIDDQFVIYCPFCHKNYAIGVRKVRYHAHVSGEYSNGVKVKHYEAGQYIIICCNKCNLQLSFNKKKLSVTSVLPQRISLRFHIQHETYRIDGRQQRKSRSHTHYQGQGDADRIPWYSIQGVIKID